MLKVSGKQLGLSRVEKHYLQDVERMDFGCIRCLRVVDVAKLDKLVDCSVQEDLVRCHDRKDGEGQGGGSSGRRQSVVSDS